MPANLSGHNTLETVNVTLFGSIAQGADFPYNRFDGNPLTRFSLAARSSLVNASTDIYANGTSLADCHRNRGGYIGDGRHFTSNDHCGNTWWLVPGKDVDVTHDATFRGPLGMTSADYPTAFYKTPVSGHETTRLAGERVRTNGLGYFKGSRSSRYNRRIGCGAEDTTGVSETHMPDAVSNTVLTAQSKATTCSRGRRRRWEWRSA